MTPELEAALWWASASEDERWEKCGLDKLEWCSTLANAKYGMLNKAAWAEIAEYVRRREAMSCDTCSHRKRLVPTECALWEDSQDSEALCADIKFCGAWEKRDDSR